MDRVDASESAARLLVRARRTGDLLTELPAWCRPAAVEDALAIQEQTGKLLGGLFEGWKCGMPADGRPILAPIPASIIVRSALCPVRSERSKARVEPEIAYVLASDLPSREHDYSRDEVLAAVGEVRLALEIVGSRFRDPARVTFPELLADSLFNQGLLIGPPAGRAAETIPHTFPIAVEQASGHLPMYEGRHRDQDPCLPLCWLANFPGRRPRGLRAGQTVITGSYAGVLELPLDEEVRIRFGDLGELCVTFNESLERGAQ